jgi:hypothetical protein
MRCVVVGSALLLSLLACTEEHSNSELVDRYVAALNTESAALCRCAAGFSEFSSTDECLSAPLFGLVDDERRTCLLESVERDEAVRDYLECMIPVEQDLAYCVVQRLDCGESGLGIEPCLAPYFGDRQTCQAMDVSIELDFCWYSEWFSF